MSESASDVLLHGNRKGASEAVVTNTGGESDFLSVTNLEHLISSMFLFACSSVTSVAKKKKNTKFYN